MTTSYNLSTFVSTKFQYVEEKSDDFLSLFPHRAAFLRAPHVTGDEKPDWETVNSHCLSDRLINQGSYLYGVRFGRKTNYLLIDIDVNSRLHPYNDCYAIGRLVEALEPLGFYKYLAVSSSYSGGIHLYFPYGLALPSWAIAQAAAALLERAGFKIAAGQLELFPNIRRAAGIDYNGHRLPLQTGSYILDDAWQPIFTSRELFVSRWNRAVSYNAPSQALIDECITLYCRRHYSKIRGSARDFLNDLNAEIEPGWTGPGQTNRLLGRIVMREYIFHHAIFGGTPLRGVDLALRVLSVAVSLPGYQTWCKHQFEIHHKVDYWTWAIERDPKYYPYSGDRIEVTNLETNHQPSWNELQSSDARERIRAAVDELVEFGQLPATARARQDAIKAIARCSGDTLYKNKDLWHPEEMVKPLPDGAIQPSADETTDLESLKPLPDGAIQPSCTISFNSAPIALRTESDSDAITDQPPGGSGGFSTEPEPEPEPPPPRYGPDIVKAVLAQINESRQRRKQIEPIEPPPDEIWFNQLRMDMADLPPPDPLGPK